MALQAIDRGPDTPVEDIQLPGMLQISMVAASITLHRPVTSLMAFSWRAVLASISRITRFNSPFSFSRVVIRSTNAIICMAFLSSGVSCCMAASSSGVGLSSAFPLLLGAVGVCREARTSHRRHRRVFRCRLPSVCRPFLGRPSPLLSGSPRSVPLSTRRFAREVPIFFSLPSPSTVTMTGHVAFLFSPGTSPLFSRWMGFFGVCGSRADLSGPPRRGPPGAFPFGRLTFPPSRDNVGSLMVATGGPLLGRMEPLQRRGQAPWNLSNCQSVCRRGSPWEWGSHRPGNGVHRGGLLGGGLLNRLGSCVHLGLLCWRR